MKVEKIKESLYHIYNCEYPIGNTCICSKIKDNGIGSLLVIQKEDGPFPSLQVKGLWSYKRPVNNIKKLSIFEKYRISDFINYERNYKRPVGIYIKSKHTNTIELLLSQIQDINNNERPFPDDEQCCQPFQMGCNGKIVCHGTTLENFKKILIDMKLKSKRTLDKDINQEYSMKENVGEPEDFLDYVMFANGNCVAPEFVIESRRQNRFLFPDEVVNIFYPGVRLFYNFKELCNLENKAFDGIHPIKLKYNHELTYGLVLITIPAYDINGNRINHKFETTQKLIKKIEYFDNRCIKIPEWCKMVYDRAIELL